MQTHSEMNKMLVELSPPAYLALCGLVRDAMLTDSDASFLLQRVIKELGSVTADGAIPDDFSEQPEHIEALRRVGFSAA